METLIKETNTIRSILSVRNLSMKYSKMCNFSFLYCSMSKIFVPLFSFTSLFVDSFHLPVSLFRTVRCTTVVFPFPRCHLFSLSLSLSLTRSTCLTRFHCGQWTETSTRETTLDVKIRVILHPLPAPIPNDDLYIR